MSELGPIPLDDLTLAAIEHAIGARIGDDGIEGADFQLPTLLDWLAGSVGDDPNAEVLIGGVIPGIDEPRAVLDTRPTYHVYDLVSALVAEVRRLRGVSE